jgi:hypothetical protein
LREMEIQHFSHEEHPLMLVEELENEVVCSGCDKSVSCGPAYKCSPCKFFLHKSCAELPREIQHHPLHPNHTLLLKAPSKNFRFCDACLKFCERFFAYDCNSCNFVLDIECASIWPTKLDACHQHEFVPIFQQIQFTCKLCGEDCSTAAQPAHVCLICRHLAHTLCAVKPRTIKISADRHLLTLIYSLGQVIMKEHDDVFCKLCYKKVNLKYAGYYCQQCDFVSHLECVGKNLSFPSKTLDSSIDLIEDIDFEEVEECDELHHFNHECILIISRNEVEVHDHKLCEGCVQSISVPFYSCEQCNYFLHSTCARLPLKKLHPSHPHPLTLSARGNYIDGIVYCNYCGGYSHGFTYTCHGCNYSFDIQCCSIPKSFKHEVHQHSLNHAISSVENCNACDGWNKCRNCNRPHDGVFVCTKCNFALGFECATLPLKAKYDYHPHPLSLTHGITAEIDDSEKYYCLICEEERNANHWFYCCIQCNFAAHTRCVVGWNPYIKYGRSFISNDHQHPLTFEWKTKVSLSCDACGEAFDGDVALTCKQCKFSVHWGINCRKKLSDKIIIS